MYRLAAVFLILLTSACTGNGKLQRATYSPPIGSIVLRVEVTSVEYTDWSPSCAGKDDNCVPVYFWYRYHARVKSVISGDWDKSDVEFTNLQHAEYIREVTRDCYVVLTPAGADISSKIGVPLISDKLLSPFFKEDRVVIKALTHGA